MQEEYQKTSTLSDGELTIRVPYELRQEAQQIAIQQGETLSNIVCLAISSYVATYSVRRKSSSRRMDLEEARQLMKTFGHGLGEGKAPHNAARHHDEYLYGK